ncbi:MAG TPA: purine-nucleoside phosphorylase, partial [Clostridiales bacterium]|nr:purine-nucleoside phosphorylase [Clostridiales bacterium]
SGLRQITLDASERLGISIRTGIYAMMQGPSYETPAEIRMLRMLGADAVGMSTVPEVLAAVHAQMKVLGISCITNMAAGILKKSLTHQEVLETANQSKDKFIQLINAVIAAL